MDRSMRILAAVIVLVAAVFLTMGRIIDSAPIGEWGLPVLLFMIGGALLFWDYYESHPRTAAARPLDEADDEAAVLREFTPQLPAARADQLPTPPAVIVTDSTVGANRTVDKTADTITITPDTPIRQGESASAAADDAAMPPLSTSAPGVVETVAPVTFVSDAAKVLRDDERTPSISEMQASTPADTIPSPEYVGEETAAPIEHAGAVSTDAVSKPKPFTEGTVTPASSDSPHMSESGSRENATKEAPPLSSIPQDKSVQATDKSAPANDPVTVTVLEANNAPLGKQSIGDVVGDVTPEAAEAVVPAVKQASSENADASTKAVAADTPMPEAGDAAAPAAQDAAMPTGNVETAATVTFVSDAARVLRDDERTPSISEMQAPAPAGTIPSPEYVGEETAAPIKHPGAVSTDAVPPVSGGSPRMSESGSRENATKEVPPLSSIPQDKSAQASDKSAPANDPATVTVLEANNATLGKQSIGDVVGEVTPKAAEAVVSAVKQASSENADASTKAVAANTPMPEAGDAAAPASQDAAMPTGNVASAAARKEADTASTPTGSVSLPPPPSERATDNLTVIEGIGPKIAAALMESGVTTFDKLASLPEAEIRSILSAAEVRVVGSVAASMVTWQEQADLAARGEFDALKEWKATHKYGAGD